MFRKTTRQIVRRGRETDEQLDAPKKRPAFLPEKKRILFFAVAALIIVIIAAIVTRPRNAQTIPEGQAVFTLPTPPALCGAVNAGDVVGIYSGGRAGAQLRYVRVYAVADDALLLLLDDAQARALYEADNPTAALVSCGDAQRAGELLALQSQINAPRVSLSLPEEVMLVPGEAVVLAPELTLEPEDGILPELLWSTEDEAVATVSGGIVAAHGVGATVVTVRCGSAYASCAVTVGVSHIMLDRTELLLLQGETAQLTAAPEPAGAADFAVQWSTDNAAVAAVSDTGAVTAVGIGTARITARCGEICESCAVTVGVHAELARLDTQILPLVVGQSAMLSPSVYPTVGVIDEAVWESSDPAIASVDAGGTVTALKAGTVTVTFRCGNAAASCTVTVAAHTPQ